MITETYMKVQYFLHSMKENNPEKFAKNNVIFYFSKKSKNSLNQIQIISNFQFDEKTLIEKSRLDEKFGYLNPNYCQQKVSFNTLQDVPKTDKLNAVFTQRVRTAGRGLLSHQANECTLKAESSKNRMVIFSEQK